MPNHYPNLILPLILNQPFESLHNDDSELKVVHTTTESHVHMHPDKALCQQVYFRCMVRWRVSGHTTQRSAAKILIRGNGKHYFTESNEHMYQSYVTCTHTSHFSLSDSDILTACSAVFLSTLVQWVNNTVSKFIHFWGLRNNNHEGWPHFFQTHLTIYGNIKLFTSSPTRGQFMAWHRKGFLSFPLH